ncbi:aminotransferase class IV [Kriegella aquimaris]|uniref:branched-chain-amino-acid transaminase n=1 Tax=Kriegella aquimaris TaxID=192904 RepID=A0A1G9J9G6_9FLAO|nr:aminotransferase class IV [Kriegella aquimaris]SDL34128.1 branched-chain amino acid aminotransferase [Kriegella aquimaris]
MSGEINFNGDLHARESLYLNHENRGLRYGDGLFETLRVIHGKIIFWEDHYLRLMASMRILRMEIPMSFTMEFLEEELLRTLRQNALIDKPARVRLSVFRNNGGLYTPLTNEISYIIETVALDAAFYQISDGRYEVELFKDFYLNSDMLSTLKTNNKILNVVGSIFAKENGYENCLLLNQDKQVAEALNGNIFLVKNGVIKTPPLKDGCLNGIIRKKVMEIVTKTEDYTLEETSISPFELQKADELFITNSVVGIRPITKYRKKEFERAVATQLLGKLNALARLT